MRKRTKLKKRYQTNKTIQKLIDIELELQQSYTNERRNQEAEATSKNRQIESEVFLLLCQTFFKTQT